MVMENRGKLESKVMERRCRLEKVKMGLEGLRGELMDLEEGEFEVVS
jgi:hypothetical protein